jgi:hypothetical protein
VRVKHWQLQRKQAASEAEAIEAEGIRPDIFLLIDVSGFQAWKF